MERRDRQGKEHSVVKALVLRLLGERVSQRVGRNSADYKYFPFLDSSFMFNK